MPPRRMSKPGEFCSHACRLAANQDKIIARRAESHVMVVCAWEDCPKRDVLIEVTPFGAKRPRYHDGCGLASTRTGVWVTCENCPKRFRKIGSRLGSEHHFCSQDCHYAWFRRQWRCVKCTACGEERRYNKSGFPKTADPQMMTWTCPGCTKKARIATHTYRCEYEGCEKPDFVRLYPSADQVAPRFCSREHHFAWLRAVSTAFIPTICAQCLRDQLQVEHPDHRAAYAAATFPMPRSRLSRPAEHRFCTKSHRAMYYMILQRDRCKREGCNAVIMERHNKWYCSRACYDAARTERPRVTKRTTEAERKILKAWAKGIRGVRPLAKEAGVSKTTVMKFRDDGKLPSLTAAPTPETRKEEAAAAS